jgi:hypothetical protein
MCYFLVADGALAHAVRSLMRELLPLSQALQADLEESGGYSRLDRLKFHAACSEAETAARLAGLGSETATSKAA